MFVLCVSISYAQVVINEFLYNPVGTDSDQEWIELYNSSTQTLSVDGWMIQRDNNSPNEWKTVITLSGLIVSHAFLIITRNQSLFPTLDEDIFAISSTNLALGNASSKSDAIQLINHTGAIQDRVVYGSDDSDGICDNRCIITDKVSDGSSLSRFQNGNTVFFRETTAIFQTPGLPNNNPSPCDFIQGEQKLIITEIAPSIPNQDYIEFFTTSQTNLCGVQIFEDGQRIKVFPSVTPGTNGFGSYVLFHASQRSLFNADDTDISGDLNRDTVIDIFSDESTPSLIGTTGNITIKDKDDNIIDFVSWTNGTSYIASKREPYDAAVQSWKWHQNCNNDDELCYIKNSIQWNGDNIDSISRIISLQGFPMDIQPSSPSNYHITFLTPGRGYNINIQNTHNLTVTQSPFSPYGHGHYTKCVIAFIVPPQSVVSLKIYDTVGRLRAILLSEYTVKNSERQVITWDGKDINGNVVPIGIYIVQLGWDNNQDSDTQSTTVVVGKKI